jgi:site-specific recombinase XerD
LPEPRPEIRWERLPLARELALAREWLLHQAASGLSAVTVDAYSRAVERYLEYCRARRLRPSAATTEHIAEYLRELAAAGLRGATLAQRLTALRLFYAHIVERGLRADNPATGPIAPAGSPGESGRPLLPLAPPTLEPDEQLPWIPREEEWVEVLDAAATERPRTRVMLALAYDAALRREEVCGLRPVDLDLRLRTVRVAPASAAGVPARARRAGQRPPAERAEALGRAGRVVPLSPLVADQCAAYLHGRTPAAERGGKDREDHPGAAGGLFLSESPRNRAEPITIWTWSKVVQAIARRAGVERFTTHTPRHLRLADLARAGWNAGEVARFAGHVRRTAAFPYFDLAREVPGPSGPDVAAHRDTQLARRLFRLHR